MKYQKIIQAKNNLDKLIEDAESSLADLRYKSECISQTLKFMNGCDVAPHKAGRGDDNGERKKQARGLSNEILDILKVDTKPACAKEILQCLHDADEIFERCTINSVTGLLTLMIQNGKLGRIKQGKAFHYFINRDA